MKKRTMDTVQRISVALSQNPVLSSFGHRVSQGHSGTQELGEWGLILTYGGYMLFAALLLLKVIYDFCRGLFVPTFIIICLYGIFFHANQTIKREVAKMEQRNVSCLKKELSYLLLCIFVIHYLFSNGMYNFLVALNFVTLRTFSDSVTIPGILWILIRSDITVKLLTVIIKIAVIMLPANILNFDRRGCLYLFIEKWSQLTKSLLSTQPWIYYLYQSYQGLEKLLALLLCALYLVFKAPELVFKISCFVTAFNKLLQSKESNFKQPETVSGSNCPICLDQCKSPIALRCTHVFCKQCFITWYQQHNTCPLCRDKVDYNPNNNVYFDIGSTSYFVQII